MLALRLLTRPSVLAPSVAAAAAICGLAVWHARATAPVPQAPSIDARSEAPAMGWSVRSASTEDAVPAAQAFALQLTDKDNEETTDWGYRSFAHDARFPAVSADGTIAVLFEDSEDFTGAPITTLVAWSKSGKRVATFAIGGHGWSGDEKKVLAKTNAWLARSSWSSLDAEAPGAWDDDYTKQTITFSSGAPLVFDAYSGHLTRGGRAIRAGFGSPGSSDEGSCGSITGIAHAFRSDRLLVLVPSMNLGGDSCFGSPSADVATAVALR
ncbi:MAG TPA: hypothetical protein VGM90_23915 [Kofleriaceae bacterium]|jgi:hypothetical protein